MKKYNRHLRDLSRLTNFESNKEIISFFIIYIFAGFIFTQIFDMVLNKILGNLKLYNQIHVLSLLAFIFLSSFILYTMATKRIKKIKTIIEVAENTMEELATTTEGLISTEKKLYREEILARNIFNNATLIVYTWDLEGKITSFNPYAEEITGYREEEILGKSWMELFIDEKEAKKVEGLIRYVKTGRTLKSIIGNLWKTKDNSTIELIWTTSPIFDNDGKVTEIMSFGTNITEHKNLVKKLNKLAYYDDLTGLPNWKSAEDRVNKIIKKACKNDIKIALLSIDIDNFKQINDTIGHEAGDRLLIFISQILKDNHHIHYVSKFNEDEFGILLYDIKDKNHVKENAKKILKDIRQPWGVEGYNFQISVSMGISIYPDNGKDFRELMKQSNMSMYQVKENGKDGYLFYDDEMKRNVENNIFIMNSIEYSMKNGHFSLHYQPIIDLGDKDIYGAEALIRWFHPEKGYISPMEFIPLIEESGQIIEVTSMILKMALEQKSIWNKKGYKNIKLAINISGKSFVNGNLYEEIKKLLNEYNISPGEIILEITETALVNNMNICSKTLGRLKSLGLEIALDDFGTGYSSLARLKGLPLEYLKIDKYFIDAIEKSSSEEAVVKYIVDLANRLNLKTIAEGVEVEEQVDLLKEIGCNLVQGYYFAKPMSVDEIEEKFLYMEEGIIYD